ncbi:SUKH-3 domain-containing protein [Streptomyces sp. KS_16]|uniref:SUKH-3 domain-containing protein n=1 Tax=unclassified Streptomyces TaxID=2593676 RepID=UPI0035262603
MTAHGCQARLFPEAEDVLRSYGPLDVPFFPAAGHTDRFNACARFCSDTAEQISDTMDDTRQPVFPIGWERIQNGLVAMDPDNRMY